MGLPVWAVIVGGVSCFALGGALVLGVFATTWLRDWHL